MSQPCTIRQACVAESSVQRARGAEKGSREGGMIRRKRRRSIRRKRRGIRSKRRGMRRGIWRCSKRMEIRSKRREIRG